VDDAHLFEPGAWLEIERLLTFKPDRQPALELLLAGPPALLALLQERDVVLRTNAPAIETLPAPSVDDIVAYLNWRLERYAMTARITAAAKETIAAQSAGHYTAANVLCQLALLLANRNGEGTVDGSVVRDAVATLVARHAHPAQSKPASKSVTPRVAHQAYVLISRDGRVVGRKKLGNRTLLGRSEHNDIALPSPYLSRHHAVIVGTPEGYYIVDLNSVNGMTLNGRPLTRAALCDDDIVSIGPFRLKLQMSDSLNVGNLLPTASDLLADTAVMPPPEQSESAIRRVK
jgi:hypothetical protein